MSTATSLKKGSRAALVAKVREREQELQSMYALLNAGAPINQLPAELLVEIFTQLQSEDDSLHWLYVLQVCRHWFVVGSTTATLWRNLKVQDNTNLLRTGLARSRSAQFSVEVVSYSIHPLSEVAGLLVPHTHRLQSLNLDNVPMDCLPAFTMFMENDMPALRHLSVTADPPDESEVVLALSPMRFPQLQELTITGIQILGHLAIGSQLQKIDISECYGKDPEITTTALLDALRTMRNLKELYMQNMYVCDTDNSPTVLETNKVGLDHLLRVSIDTEGPLIKAILSTIVIPATASASFTCPIFGDTWPRSAPNLRAVIPDDKSCLPILSNLVAACVSITHDEHYLEGYTTLDADPRGPRDHPEVEFCIDIPDAAVAPIQAMNDIPAFDFGDLLYVFRDAPLQSLTIETMPSVVGQADWRELFATFPALRSIELTVSGDGGLPGAGLVFSALDPGRTRAAATGERTQARSNAVLCPDLRRIRITGLAGMDSLTRVATCLENRRRALGRPEGRLEQLALDLVDHEGGPFFHERRAAYLERLASLVDDLNYHDQTSADDEE